MHVRASEERAMLMVVSAARAGHAQFNRDKASFRRLRAMLPRAAHHIYYRDMIGNISSSDLRSAARPPHAWRHNHPFPLRVLTGLCACFDG